MAADFKSHILRRDEKGMFGIPFPRLLLAGVGGGLAYTAFSLLLPGWAIPLGIVCGLLLVIFTGNRDGLPRWRRWLIRWRGSLLLAAADNPSGFAAWIVKALDLPPDLAVLDGERVFAPPDVVGELDLREWITFATAADQDGLVFVDTPLGGDA